MVSAERIQVTLSGGAPWGFRLSGGGALPLTINKIRKKSQAHVQGLREGDAVISINGVHVHDKTQDEALELVEQASDSLTLEIFRGDIDDLTRDKPKKTIQIPTVHDTEGEGVILLTSTVEDNLGANVESSSVIIVSTSLDNVTSDSFDTAESDHSFAGSKLTASVDGVPGSTFPAAEPPSGHIITASVNELTPSTSSILLESSPVISAVRIPEVEDVQSSSNLSASLAQPFRDSKPKSPSPVRFSPGASAPPTSPQASIASVNLQRSQSPQAPPRWSPQPPSDLSPHPQQRLSPQPPAVSPKPQRLFSPQPPPVSPKPPGVTSSATSTTFDDGETRREVTREQHVQSSDNGHSTTIVQKETTTTTRTSRPSFVKNQTSFINSIPPSDVAQTPKSTSAFSKRTATTTVINQKGPTPFLSSLTSSLPEPLFQTPPLSSSRSAGNLSNTGPPLFKPSKFVAGSGKKDLPGLYTPASPLLDSSVLGMFKEGKENMSPQPMFQVKNIVPDKAKSRGTEMWSPNIWLPGQQPISPYDEPSVTTPREDVAPSSPFPKPKPGFSLVEEQKRKLLQSQTSTTSAYDAPQEPHDSRGGQHKHVRLHVFAPPVEIHLNSGYSESPYSPYGDQFQVDEDDNGPESPDSLARMKKKLYADSAFYDTPGKSYPTIPEQMKLCKKIAQSLTSAANRRARGAKMFMKRKRKSSKWIHEGHSELSSSAGDVANIQELESELSPDEGGNKPLMYFKIPNLKNRIGSENKNTKMVLSQEEFENVRLTSKRCEHKSVPPNLCFDIVADLKAHKGKGGRLFERRKERSDKFVIDETNTKFVPPQAKLGKEKTPWAAALESGGRVDAAFSQFDEWERNQKLNQILKYAPPPKVQTTPLPPSFPDASLPIVRTSLKSDESPQILKGKNFNREAKGWMGGGEYPIAESLHHVSPTTEVAPPRVFVSEQQSFHTKVKTLQDSEDSTNVSGPAQNQQRGQRSPAQYQQQGQRSPSQNQPQGQRSPSQNQPQGQRSPSQNQQQGQRIPAQDQQQGQWSPAQQQSQRGPAQQQSQRIPAQHQQQGQRIPAQHQQQGQWSPAQQQGQRSLAQQQGQRSPAQHQQKGQKGPAQHQQQGQRGPAQHQQQVQWSPAQQQTQRGPAQHQQQGQRGPAQYQQQGQRGPAQYQQQGQRGPAQHQQQGQRGPAQHQWQGQRGPAEYQQPGQWSPAQHQQPGQWNAQRQDDWRGASGVAELRQEAHSSSRRSDYQSPRPKSWQADTLEAHVYRDTRAPVDYRHGSTAFPTLAYQQPIIPGTDL